MEGKATLAQHTLNSDRLTHAHPYRCIILPIFRRTCTRSRLSMGPTGHRTPPSPPLHPPTSAGADVREVAPFRLWSAESALPLINLHHYKSLTDRYPPAFNHWTSTLQALDSQMWHHQWASRLRWNADHRIDETRTARVVTPLGTVAGGDISTASPRFTYDPHDPVPELDSVTLTGKHKRLNGWRELAGLVPPALTSHSDEVFDNHRAGSGAMWNNGGTKSSTRSNTPPKCSKTSTEQ